MGFGCPVGMDPVALFRREVERLTQGERVLGRVWGVAKPTVGAHATVTLCRMSQAPADMLYTPRASFMIDL